VEMFIFSNHFETILCVHIYCDLVVFLSSSMTNTLIYVSIQSGGRIGELTLGVEMDETRLKGGYGF
ncbi:hypothetical protein, partial [Vibrio parahaemolyticus]|uniref:hypothetical protein n=1 Tax=Vibrio parahaemolyticus TaxID=670 RepID=UPI00248A9F80